MAHPLSEHERLAWLRLARAPNVGPVTFAQLVRRFGSATAALKEVPKLVRRGGGDAAALPSEDDARAEIEALHEKQIHERSIAYQRSDGSTFRLTIADILARRAAFEMAYNPNDCVEIRWGASSAAPDFGTCQRHAPDEQRARMQEYRAWFHEAKRPLR